MGDMWEMRWALTEDSKRIYAVEIVNPRGHVEDVVLVRDLETIGNPAEHMRERVYQAQNRRRARRFGAILRGELDD